MSAGLVDEARGLRGRLGCMRITAAGLSDAAETAGGDIDFARRLASVRAVH